MRSQVPSETDCRQGAGHTKAERRLIEAISRHISQQQEPPDGIGPLLDGLGFALRKRYARDVDEGVFEEAVFLAPWLTARTESLRQQHVELLGSIDTLGAMVRQRDGSPEWWTRFGDQFGEFVLSFEEHESLQCNLLHESYVADDRMLD